MKRFIKLSGLPFLGFGFVLVGFVYGVVFCSIPYQDPTPQQQSSENFHQFISNVILMSGLTIFLLGLVAAPIVWMMTKKATADQVAR